MRPLVLCLERLYRIRRLLKAPNVSLAHAVLLLDLRVGTCAGRTSLVLRSNEQRGSEGRVDAPDGIGYSCEVGRGGQPLRT
jgi:hypothetical protein